MSTKKNFWIGLPMQMMYGLVLGVIVGTMVSSEFGATYLQPLPAVHSFDPHGRSTVGCCDFDCRLSRLG